MNVRFQKTVQRYAPPGKKVDAVGSLEHLFRVPGTLNQKLDTPRPVTIIKESRLRHNPDDIEQYLINDQQDPPLGAGEISWDGKISDKNNLPRAQPELIIKNCPAMRWLVEHSPEHTEPQWKLFVDVFAHCQGGREYIHKVSRQYLHYDFEQTEKKITHALKIRPRTCKNIQESLPEQCHMCKHQVKSPAVLGLPPKPFPEISLQVGPYAVIKNELFHLKETLTGLLPGPVANCHAMIDANITYDNGIEQTRMIEISGRMYNGQALPAVRVPAQQFPGMGWMATQWGTGPVIYAGFSKKDHFRAATQLLRPNPVHLEVIGHTGWRRFNGQWVFCHNGGAIGPGGSLRDITVELPGPLADYDLPDPPEVEQLKKMAGSAASKLLGLTDPDLLAATLFCCIGRAPLAEVRPIDFSMAVIGGTGVQKTSATVIAQGFFGKNFNHRHLPGNWASTANSLEKAASQAKDVIYMIDDFAPAGCQADVQRLHRDADRLLRGVGNQGGRMRMRSDATLRAEYHAKGLIIITGEDVPRGHSLRARLWTVEIKRRDVNLQILSELQQMATDGALAMVMAGYIEWLAGRIDEITEQSVNTLAAIGRNSFCRVHVMTGYPRPSQTWYGAQRSFCKDPYIFFAKTFCRLKEGPHLLKKYFIYVLCIVRKRDTVISVC